MSQRTVQAKAVGRHLTLTKRTVALEDYTHMYMGISFLLLHVHEYRKYIDKSIIPLIKFRIL